jgi:hypothetical protein
MMKGSSIAEAPFFVARFRAIRSHLLSGQPAVKLVNLERWPKARVPKN